MRHVDLHRIAEAPSLAYHRAIAERLLAEPEILERARQRVRQWLASRPDTHYARGWSDVLQRPVPEVIAFLTDDGEAATDGTAAVHPLRRRPLPPPSLADLARGRRARAGRNMTRADLEHLMVQARLAETDIDDDRRRLVAGRIARAVRDATA
jgi:hypothetical protein